MDKNYPKGCFGCRRPILNQRCICITCIHQLHNSPCICNINYYGRMEDSCRMHHNDWVRAIKYKEHIIK